MKMLFENFNDKFQCNSSSFRRKLLYWILISISIPLLVISMNKLSTIIYPMYVISTLLLLGYGYNLMKYREIKKDDNITHYIIYPLIFPVLITMFTSYFSQLITNNANPQNLSVVSFEDMIKGVGRSVLAGSEEVWRFILMSTLIYFFMIAFKKFKHEKLLKFISMLFSLLISSLLFGWLHTFSYSSDWINYDITISLSLMGLMFGLIIVLTNNLWCAILTHIMFDIYANVKLYSINSFFMMFGITGCIVIISYIILLTRPAAEIK